MKLKGIIQENGTVLGSDGKEYFLPTRGTDEEGYPEVLIDAESCGGDGFFSRQSIKPYLGMGVSFFCNTRAPHGFGYEIIKGDKNE